jgi:glycine cleavage system aminomethyltransferase T
MHTLPHSPFLPYDPSVTLYQKFFGFLAPYNFSGPKDEVEAVDTACNIHAGLNPTTTYKLSGPDALKFLSDHCANSFAKFPVGSGKHAIMCNEKGQVIQDGVLVRTGEQEFMTYWLAPYIDFALQKGNYDAVGEDLTGRAFLLQLSGLRSLETLERAAREDLHDVKFLRWVETTIAGAKVNVLRMGMAGTLAYEIHGRVEDAPQVYAALHAAGEPFGIRRIGLGSYGMSHTEYGYPQFGIHMLYPWEEEPGLMEYFMKRMARSATEKQAAESIPPMMVRGSLGSDRTLRYFNPIELGWGKMVKFDHEFVGRAALEKEVANPKRTTVTLEWSQEDILDVFKSQFGKEDHRFMDFHREPNMDFGGSTLFADKVLKDGREIGLSAGRVFSWRYRRMISLGVINVDQSEIGNEVTILWGEPGSRQKEIRARVERFPYFQDGRNQSFDTSAVPRLELT